MASQIIKLQPANEQERKVLLWAEKYVCPTARELNARRLMVCGIRTLSQASPLPAPFESIRAFFIRLGEKVKKL